jgi:AraC family transcriptional regulator of adaptative response / DNA-3-methyladenine glycosylase II
VSPSLAPVLGAVLQRCARGLDLDADPAWPSTRCWPRCPARLPPGLRLPGGMDGFETAVRVILGQQVTVKAARTLTSAWWSASARRSTPPTRR